MSDFPITLFADFTCPYSYVTDAALSAVVEEGIAGRSDRAFELYPDPDEPLAPPPVDAELEPLQPLAAAVGVVLRAPRFRARTRKAHEAARFARAQGLEPEMRRAIFAGYWSGALDIGRVDVLIDLADGVGLAPEELRIALDIDRFTEEVIRDEELAARLGIESTPTLFIGVGPAARVIVGAHDPGELRRLIITETIKRTES